MLLTKFKYYAGFLIVADAAAMATVFVGTYALRNSILVDVFHLAPLFPWEHYLPLAIFLIPAWIGLLFWLGGYSLVRERYLQWAFILSAKTTLGGIVILAAYLFVSKNIDISRTFLFLSSLGNGLIIFAHRAMFYVYINKTGKNKHLAKNLIVIGTKTHSERMLHNIQDHDHLGLNLTDYFELEETDDDNVLMNNRFEEILKEIRSCLNIKSTIVDEVVVCLPRTQVLQFEPISKICMESGIRVSLLSDLFPIQNPQINVSTLHGLGMITIDPALGREHKYALKKTFDLVLASILLILLSPLMVFVSILIRLASPGPIFFRQTRVGHNGRRFQMLKFRTMVAGAEEQWGDVEPLNVLDGPVFKAVHDPRLTPIGRFMRRVFIDELPQLFNVLKGDMSIVGPRPPLPSEVNKYKLWHSKRLSMKPGITGLWQVEGRSKFVSFEEWMRMDIEYVEGWSLWLDFKILLKTVPEVIRCTGV